MSWLGPNNPLGGKNMAIVAKASKKALDIKVRSR